MTSPSNQHPSMAPWAVAALVLIMFAVAVQGVEHSVGGGGSSGWSKPNGNTLPATYLQDWAQLQSFKQGDRLLFEYNPVAHDVLVVSLADYVICNTLSPIAKYTSGKDSVPVPAGMSYYICGLPTHCELGQKFNITAAASTNSAAGRNNNLHVGLEAVVVATITLWITSTFFQ